MRVRHTVEREELIDPRPSLTLHVKWVVGSRFDDLDNAVFVSHAKQNARALRVIVGVDNPFAHELTMYIVFVTGEDPLSLLNLLNG